MPDELCPIVGSFIRSAKECIKCPNNYAADLLCELEDIEEYARGVPWDTALQRLRAFYCLHNLALTLRACTQSQPKLDLPLSREGVNELIEFSREAKDSAEVSQYYQALVNKLDFGQLEAVRAARTMRLADIVVSAGEFIRPRLRNGESLGGIGKIFCQGLAVMDAPIHKYIIVCRELIHVTPVRRGES